MVSDAFSQFIQKDPLKSEYNEDIKQATIHLFTKVIPDFAKILLENFSILKNQGDFEEFSLIEKLHSFGINIRHLGIVAMEVNKLSNPLSPHLVALIRLEIFARIVKLIYRQKLRETMKKLKVPVLQPYVIEICQYFNTVFGNSKDSVNNFKDKYSFE